MNKSQTHDRHALSISLRLRQLGETLLRDQRRIYELYSLDFDPKCFPVFHQLSLHPEGMTIMELARTLGVTHPAVIKQARSLERDQWIQSKQVKDLRKRLLVLTQKGLQRLPELQVAWNDMHTCLSTALDSLKINLLDAMNEVEPAFEKRSFFDSVSEYKKGRLIRETQLVPCTTKEHWNYFELACETGTQKLPELARQYFSSLLLNTRQRIQTQEGGGIWILEVNAQPAGSVAMMHRGDQVYQLTWLNVEENYRRLGLGKQLVEHALQNFRKLGGRRVFLESHAQYPEANALLQRLNFRSFVRPAAHQHEAKLVLMERYL